ncbi:GNAT family N-acetyltransferase [Pararobbsia silviterrae]|uniref:GNAT family N-acetyltransferase n=1 Tax=Pararobbsia silviterrae TaxID=1792498 RepID=A0A494XYU7_9BURK|nr:GNAT family N-acetyltransferase [Pararobbsia silviterrae]RKP55692.1 GNAT family N-acetyltransferase [Pararobbsia silviterrae]
MPIALRAARPEDAASIADVYFRSRTALVACAPLTHSADAILEWIADWLVPSGDVVVALDGERIVGLSATSAAYGVVWLDQLYVDPRDIGRGIGAALLNEVVARAQTAIQLYTFSENLRARTFYERHGFVALEPRDASSNEAGVPDMLYRRAFP